MILKDVADITGFDISTISRVVKSKYADTPSGIILLKNLFSDSLTNDDGEEVSTKEIKNHLQEVISQRRQKKTSYRRCSGRSFERKRLQHCQKNYCKI
jgi:RNA polymerase sigma-54 factor